MRRFMGMMRRFFSLRGGNQGFTPPAGGNHLLQESGGNILLENGGAILLDP